MAAHALIALTLCLLISLAAVGHARELHVAPDGDDANAGTVDAPLATLAGAVAAARTAADDAAPTITLHGGTYRITETVKLTAEDSGTANAPFVIRAAPGEEVRLTGGTRIGDWQPVSDAAISQRLAAEARPHVLQADLKGLGVSSFGTVGPSAAQRAELFSDQQYMTLARYPNDGFVRIADVPDEAKQKRPISDPKRPDINRHEGPFNYAGDQPERWGQASDIWVHGFWYHDWRDEYHRVSRFNLERKELWPKPPYHGYGYREGQRYYYLNILEELDQPGEWFLDREAGIVYLWPPSPIDEAEVTFPELQEPMLTLDGASHVSIRGLTLECSRAGAITVSGGEGIEVTGCVVRNVGGTGISIAGGAGHTVRSCDVYGVGATAIFVNGGDRETLAPGGHVVENCHIHHFAQVQKTYQHAVTLHGVGNRISHCAIHDSPHAGIGYAGNDHVIEYCDFTRVAQETGDVGCIYAAMDWTYTGHVFRHNYFHHIHAPGKLGCFTIYPDLPCGGIHLYGNVFYDVDQVFHTNSGRGMLIENNLFVKCRRGMRFNVWMDSQKFLPGGNWQMVERIEEIGYDKPPYSARYPMLARLAEDFALGEDEWLQRALPKDNIIRRNVSFGDSYFLNVGPQAGFEEVRVEGNLICDPIAFVGSPTGDGTSKSYRSDDEATRELLSAAGNILTDGAKPPALGPRGFRLPESSPAWELGFEPIPFGEIGLQLDEYRRTLPAAEPVIEPEAGMFIGNTQVKIRPGPGGSEARVHYTLDGTDPSPESPVYRRPIRLAETTTVRCAAFPVDGPARDRSRIVSATFRAGKLGPDHGIHLSDLPELDYIGYEPLGLLRDIAYGARPISLGGQEYPKGLITHPAELEGGNRATLTYELKGELAKAERFTARVGIEDQAPSDKPGYGTVSFAVEVRRGGEWARLFESPVMAPGATPLDVDVDISRASRLRLIVTDGGDGIAWDHGVWADAKIM